MSSNVILRPRSKTISVPEKENIITKGFREENTPYNTPNTPFIKGLSKSSSTITELSLPPPIGREAPGEERPFEKVARSRPIYLLNLM